MWLGCHSGMRIQTKAVVHHSTRSGIPGNPNELQGTINWCANTANQAGYNYLIARDGRIIQLVDPRYAAWHAGWLNAHTLGVAFVSPTEADGITPEQLEAAIQLDVYLCREWGIPPVWFDNAMTSTVPTGITQHKAVLQGYAQGKTDVGGNFDGPTFVNEVRRYLGG